MVTGLQDQSHSVVVITSALHAEGHGFKPRCDYFFFLFQLSDLARYSAIIINLTKMPQRKRVKPKTLAEDLAEKELALRVQEIRPPHESQYELRNDFDESKYNSPH